MWSAHCCYPILTKIRMCQLMLVKPPVSKFVKLCLADLESLHIHRQIDRQTGRYSEANMWSLQLLILNMPKFICCLLVCSVYNDAFSVTYIALNEGMITEWWIQKEVKKWQWPNFKILSKHLHGRTEEDHKSSVRIAGLWAEIWNQDLLNMKQEC
jgi:hypothetical protein